MIALSRFLAMEGKVLFVPQTSRRHCGERGKLLPFVVTRFCNPVVEMRAGMHRAVKVIFRAHTFGGGGLEVFLSLL